MIGKRTSAALLFFGGLMLAILVSAQATTLAEAEKQFPRQAHRPDGPLASGKNLTKTFDQPPPGGPAIELQYSSGVRVIPEIEWIGNSPSPSADTESDPYDPPADFGELVDRLADQAARDTLISISDSLS